MKEEPKRLLGKKCIENVNSASASNGWFNISDIKIKYKFASVQITLRVAPVFISAPVWISSSLSYVHIWHYILLYLWEKKNWNESFHFHTLRAFSANHKLACYQQKIEATMSHFLVQAQQISWLHLFEHASYDTKGCLINHMPMSTLTSFLTYSLHTLCDSRSDVQPRAQLELWWSVRSRGKF